MSIHTILGTNPCHRPTMTASGARLKPVRPVAALTFFEQFAAPIQGVPRRVAAWGAFEDGTTLIGAAVLACVSRATFWAQVVVAPARRRLGIGGELLSVAIGQASESGGQRLTGSYPSCALEPRLLVESQSVSVARRVRHGQAEVVLFIPEAPGNTRGDDT